MSANVPQEVYSNSWISQPHLTTLTDVVLFTPSQSGLFRISIYQLTSGGNSFLNDIGYDDDQGAQSFILGGANNQGFSAVFEATSSAPITISGGSATPGNTWSLYATLEAL